LPADGSPCGADASERTLDAANKDHLDLVGLRQIKSPGVIEGKLSFDGGAAPEDLDEVFA